MWKKGVLKLPRWYNDGCMVALRALFFLLEDTMEGNLSKQWKKQSQIVHPCDREDALFVFIRI